MGAQAPGHWFLAAKGFMRESALQALTPDALLVKDGGWFKWL
jgi:hypothetical protein